MTNQFLSRVGDGYLVGFLFLGSPNIIGGITLQIDQTKCSGYGICIPYCPAQAITLVDKKAG
jgi:NAD-dependent dihydropyrimidine dehydrogenase PreA subunit